MIEEILLALTKMAKHQCLTTYKSYLYFLGSGSFIALILQPLKKSLANVSVNVSHFFIKKTSFFWNENIFIKLNPLYKIYDNGHVIILSIIF